MTADDFDFRALARGLQDTVAGDGETQASAAGSTLQYFGDYVLEEEIARGGMGIVYRARQVSLDRVVAVKVLRDAAFPSALDIERFRVEAGAAAALRHPHIVRVHEIGEQAGTHFFSMDYVPGSTLAHALRDGPLPARKAAAIMEKIARAIHYAHTQGVLHRDIKPGNILLDPEGAPVITDFGLARHEAAEMGLTLTGQILGTPAYMAPEQAEGRSRDTGPHTDVYGLGALLYHMLTGRPPFAGESHMAILSQVLNADAVSVRLLNPSVPRDLQTICAKALMREAPRRYVSAEAMAADLQRFLDGRPVQARPVGAAGKAWRWARRHRALAIAGSLTLLALAATAIVSTVAAERLRVSRDAEVRSRGAAEALIKDMLVGMRDKLKPLNKVALLDDAASAAERYFASLPRPLSPATEQQMAAMLETQGDVLFAKANVSAALEKQQAALEIMRRLVRAGPQDVALRNQAAQATQALAWRYKQQGNAAAALPLLQQASDLKRALADDLPDNQSYRHASNLATCAYAEQLAASGKKAEAWDLLQPLLAAAGEPDITDADAVDRAAALHLHVGDAADQAGHPDEAAGEHRLALRYAERADALRPGRLETLSRLTTALERVTDSFMATRDYAEAKDLAERRVGICEQLAASDPENLQLCYGLASAHGRLLSVHRALKNTDAALTSARMARSIHEKIAARDAANLHSRGSLVTLWLDEASLLSDDSGKALALANAREAGEGLVRDDSRNAMWRQNLIVTHVNEGIHHQESGRPAKALECANAAAATNRDLQRDFPEKAANPQFEAAIRKLQERAEAGD